MFTTTSWNVLTICQVSLLTIQLGLSLISFPICFPSTEISFLQPWRLEGWVGAEDQMEEQSLVISLFELLNVFVYQPGQCNVFILHFPAWHKTGQGSSSWHRYSRDKLGLVQNIYWLYCCKYFPVRSHSHHLKSQNWRNFLSKSLAEQTVTTVLGGRDPNLATKRERTDTVLGK